MAKPKWFDIYDYKSDAQKYIDQEAKRVEEEKKREEERKATAKRNKKLQAQAAPPTIQTGMAGLRQPEQPEWFRVSQQAQQFDYEGSVNQEYEISKRSFPGLKVPNFKETVKEKTTRPGKEEDIGTLLSTVGATKIKEKKVYKYKTIDRKTNAEVVTQQKEIEIVGENQYNYFFLKSGKLASVPKDECSEVKLKKEELELEFKKNINQTAKLVQQKTQGYIGSAEELARNPTSFGKAEGVMTEDEMEAKKKEEVNNQIQPAKLGLPEIPVIDEAIRKGVKKFGKTGAGQAVQNFMESATYGSLMVPHETKGMAGTVGEIASYLSPASGPNVLFKAGEKGAAKLMTKLGVKEAEKFGVKKLVQGGVKSAGGMFGVSSAQEALSYSGNRKKVTKENLKESAKEVGVSTAFGFGLGVGTEAAKPVAKAALSKVMQKVKKMPKTAIKTRFSEATASKYNLNRDISKLDDAEKDLVAKETMDKLLTDIGKKSIEKTKKTTGGKAGPKKVLERIMEEKGIKDIKVVADTTLRGEGNYAKIYVDKTGDKVTKITLKYNNAKPRAVVAGAVEHEGKHLEDIIAGHKIPEPKAVKNPKTVYDLLKSPEHHKGFESFEVESLEQMFQEDVKVLREAPLVAKRTVKPGKYEIKSKKQLEAKTFYEKSNKTIENKTGKPIEEYQTVDELMALKKTLRSKGSKILPSKVIEAKMESLATDLKGVAGEAKAQRLKTFEKLKKIAKATETLKKLEPAKVGTSPIGDIHLGKTGEEVSAELSLAERVKESFKRKTPKEHVRIDEAVNGIQWGEEKKAWDLYKKFVDNKVAYKKVGEKLSKAGIMGKKEARALTKDTEMAAANYSKHHTVAVTIQTKNLVGRDGRTIADKSLMKLLDAGKNQPDWENYILLNHHLTRVKQDAPIFVDEYGMGLSYKTTKKMIAKLEAQFPEFKKAGDNYVNWMDEFSREWLGDNLISDTLLSRLRKIYPYYAPTTRIMEGSRSALKSNKISARVLKSATGGMQNIEPISYSLPGYVERVVRTDRKNKVYLSLVEQVLNARGMMDDIAQVKKIGNKIPQEIKDKIAKMTSLEGGMDNLLLALENKLVPIEKHGNFMIAMSRGEPILVKINDKSLWEALKGMEAHDSSAADELVRLANKATSKYKNLLTTYNPIFWAFRNPIRDIPTAYIQGAVDNPVKFSYNIMKSGAKIASYLTKEFTGIGPGSKTFTQYKALGSETSNYLRVEGKLTPNKWEKFWNAVATVGNGIESIPRFAEFEQVYKNAIKKGKPHMKAIDEALYASGEVTVDFSRHGDFTKVADAFEPYLNAEVQGLNKMYRTFVERKVATTLKSALAVTLPSSVFYMWNKNIDPEGYDNLPDYVRDNYYTIPLGDGEFWKLPKNNAYGWVFSTLFDRVFRKLEGDPYAFKNLMSSAWTNIIIPSDLVTSGIMVPLQKVLMGANKDYFGRDIVPQYMLTDKRSRKYQRDERTSWGAKVLGDNLNWSPKQVDFLIKSYLGAVGSVYFAFATKGEGNLSTYFERLQKNLGLTTDSAYGKREMREKEEQDKSQQEITDFELESGIKDLRYNLKEKGAGTNEINSRIKRMLGPDENRTWNRLKEKKKRLGED
jgi:hypothetical protein